MQLIDARNAERYLRQRGHVSGDEPLVVEELAGGVSNVVLLVSRPTGEPRFVLKQVREQLRVPEPWFCSIERIWREVAVLEVCAAALRADRSPDDDGEALTAEVPDLLFADRELYLFAMTAAPAHEVWKTQLLRGEHSERTAAACGRLLGRLHAATWQQPQVEAALRDQSFFTALRLDPYYRHVARHHPEVAPHLEALIESLQRHPRCLVHGDFSPKNILVHGEGITLVDFEVGHYGDPAFDLGFFLTHLMLKGLRAERQWWHVVRLTFAFWRAYRREVEPRCGEEEFAGLVTRSLQNLAGCLLARVDGKSRVDYLVPSAADGARRYARELMAHPPETWPQAVARFLPFATAAVSEPRGGPGDPT